MHASIRANLGSGESKIFAPIHQQETLYISLRALIQRGTLHHHFEIEVWDTISIILVNIFIMWAKIVFVTMWLGFFDIRLQSASSDI